MPRFKAALFDFDGVVVDSTPIHLDGWKEAYRALFGITLDEGVLETLVGRSTSAIGSRLAELAGDLTYKPELIKRKVVYVQGHLESIPLIPGITAFLAKLTANGVPYGVASNAPRAFIDAAITRHRLNFDFFLGLEDYTKPKPDPEPYVKGAGRMRWKTDEHRDIAVFEDSVHGIEAALAARMTAIGVCSQHSAAHLKAAGASECIKDFLDDAWLDKAFFA